MEYYLDDNFFSRLDDPQTFGAPLTLGDSDLLLFEMPGRGNFDLLRAAVEHIIKCGFTPLLAHPERYPYLVLDAAPRSLFRRLWRDRKTAECSIFHPVLAEIMQLGCLLQGDLGSFSGVYGPAAQHAANQHLARGHYHCFGSDGHNPQQLHHALAGLDVVGAYCRV
jgi:protein-tyrosine phosphatase